MRSLALAALCLAATVLPAQEKPTVKSTAYCRFQAGDTIAYGIVEGQKIRQLDGDLFNSPTPTQTTFDRADVKLLVPCEPKNVYAMAGNYQSHLGGGNITTTVTTVTRLRTDQKTGETTSDTNTKVDSEAPGTIPVKFQILQPFLKPVSCLVPDGADIVLPKDAGAVHYEAEMVIVIGKMAKKVTKEKAKDYIFGVTIGNDVSARVWQKADVQWWRAKGSDTFGPVGPTIVTGLNYDDLRLQLRHNGETKQDERTNKLIHDCAALVAGISHVCTLYPGDMIFTGTSGVTQPIQPGDTIEVDLEGVGVLTNKVVSED
ncbi:MAG: fumarylacetoacetate hydrolase family protein [Planctomycetota bacterium]|nr:fumarylacetoacetate hydrolase family protein [Planctomycetota bacterium]